MVLIFVYLKIIEIYEFSLFSLFQFSDTHPRSIEELWGTLCEFWPNNLKVILRYLVIMSSMAPTELLTYVSIYTR